MAVVGTVVLAPVALASSVPFAVVPSPVPAWFTVDTPQLPAGTVVLVVPFAGQRAMGWQAQTGLHFALAGGFAVVPDPDGRSAFVSPPSGAVAMLDRLSADPLSIGTTALPASAADAAAVRGALVRWHVDVTVVTQQGTRPAYSAGFFTAVYGRAPSFRQGVWVWTGPPGTEPLPISPDTLSACAPAVTTAPPAPLPLRVPDCVLAAAQAGAA